MKPYPQYKDSGVEWIGEVPDGWKIVPIKRIVSTKITDGPHETPEILLDGIPFVSAESIRNDSIDFSKKRGFISTEDHERFSKKYKPLKGDIYIVKSGATTGKIAIVETDEEFNIWSPLAAIRCNCIKAFPRFAFYFFKSKEFLQSIEISWNFGTQQNIGMGVIENLPLSLPSLSEQTAIAAFLDRKTAEIDSIIAKKERLIELYEEEKAAVINHTVTKGLDPAAKMKDSGIEWLGEIPENWEVKKLKWIIQIKNGEGINSSDIFESGDYPVYGGNGIVGYALDYNNKDKVFVIGRVGAKCGNIRIIDKEKWVSDNALLAYCFGNMEYVYYSILNLDLNNLANKSAQPLITSTIIKEQFICMTSEIEQAAIVQHIETKCGYIDAITSKFKRQIELLKEYRTALISEAVTGKIDVRENMHN